jgi:hypothetical protein
LGSWPRQGLARLQDKKEAQEWRKVWGNEPHIPKRTSILGVGVLVDSRMFREWLQRPKPNGSRNSLYHWKAIETWMFKMGSHHPFGHLKHKLWPKKGLGVKLVVWLPTTKSRELTRFTYVQMACDIPLESSWQGLQLCFKSHFNRRSSHKVMRPQSCGSVNFDNFGTPTWESQDKKPFGCRPCGEAHSIQGGRWWLPPSLGRGESCEFELPVARPNTKSAPTMH